jgi:hypothetical protein
MLRLFNDNKPYVLFVLPFLLAGFYTYHFMVEGSGVSHPISMGLWGRLSLSEAVLPWWIGLGFLVHLVLIISLNFIFNEANFYERNYYLPSLLSMTLMVSIQGYFGFNALHLAFLGLLLCCHQMLKLDQNIRAEKYLFNAAFFYSLSVSFFPALIFGIPILYVLSFIFRPFSLREFIVFLLGPLVVFIYVVAYRAYFQYGGFWQDVQMTHRPFDAPPGAYILWALLGFILLLIFYTLSVKWNGYSNRTRKELQLLLGMLIGISACVTVNIPFTIGLLAMPISMIFTLSFLDKRIRSASSLLYYGLLVFIVVKFLLKT